MESLYTGLVLYGSQNECARTDTVFLPLSEVCDGTVSLKLFLTNFKKCAFSEMKYNDTVQSR